MCLSRGRGCPLNHPGLPWGQAALAQRQGKLQRPQPPAILEQDPPWTALGFISAACSNAPRIALFSPAMGAKHLLGPLLVVWQVTKGRWAGKCPQGWARCPFAGNLLNGNWLWFSWRSSRMRRPPHAWGLVPLPCHCRPKAFSAPPPALCRSFSWGSTTSTHLKIWREVSPTITQHFSPSPDLLDGCITFLMSSLLSPHGPAGHAGKPKVESCGWAASQPAASGSALDLGAALLAWQPSLQGLY